ncbi:MAG: DALR anticodon-binding domain-containing protein [Lacrimispora sp.]
MDRFVSFEGNTGPYVLYTIVRIKSILAKYRELEEKHEGEEKILPPSSAAEKDLMLQLSKYNEVMETSFSELAPHKICQYVYELANAFNRFYHDTKIISQEDKRKQASWIGLIRLTKDVLNNCIGVLGIEAPERM